MKTLEVRQSSFFYVRVVGHYSPTPDCTICSKLQNDKLTGHEGDAGKTKKPPQQQQQQSKSKKSHVTMTAKF
jgi:hypothetical protein